MTATPETVRVRMYNVGFGDCFLVTFGYRAPLGDGRSVRHMLVDFGSKAGPKHGPRAVEVAERVVADVDGRLDVLVVTHRHQDHLSAFDNDNTWEVLEGLNPRRIIRPWPDHPNAGSHTTGPPLDDASRAYATALAAGERVATALCEMHGGARGLRGTLGAYAAAQVSNQVAIDHLETWAGTTGTAWVASDRDCGTGDLLPGVKMRVLGPPTLDQVSDLAKQDEDNQDEFWMLHRAFLGLTQPVVGTNVAGPPTEERMALLASPDGNGAARWLLDRMGDNDIASLLRIMKKFDDALNNTSVVLLISAGARDMLFTGDAQFENWSWTIDQTKNGTPEGDDLARALANIDLYKVGHHGSRNATPKSIYNLWGQKREPGVPLVSLVSTKFGVYPNRGPGKTDPEYATAVPRATLTRALDSLAQATGGALYSTESLAADVLCHDLTARTTKKGTFTPH